MSLLPDGAVFIREELKQREKDQLELLANRLQSDLAALSLEAVASSAVTSIAGGGGERNHRVGGRSAAAGTAARDQAGRTPGDQRRSAS